MLCEDLEILFEDLDRYYPSPEHLSAMLKCFISDFIHNPFHLDGMPVVVKTQLSYNKYFRNYPESFVHLITRDNKYNDNREFDHERANRIHWIKTILVNSNSGAVKFFTFADGKGLLKHYYWCEGANFIVVLKPILPNILIITAFKVDDHEKSRFRKRYNSYREGLK